MMKPSRSCSKVRDCQRQPDDPAESAVDQGADWKDAAALVDAECGMLLAFLWLLFSPVTPRNRIVALTQPGTERRLGTS